MADNKGRVEIDAVIDQSLKNAINDMGESVQYIFKITNDLNKTSMSTKSGVDSLNKALSTGTSSSSAYARATSNLSRNQQVLSTHFKNAADTASRLQKQVNSLNSSSTANTSATRQQASATQNLINTLNKQISVQKQIQKYSLAQSYKNQAASLTDLSNKYSMSGTRLSLSLSAPIVAFGRSAFGTFKKLEIQTVRSTKLIGDSYKTVDEVLKTTGATLSADGKSWTRVVGGQIEKTHTLVGALETLKNGLDAVTSRYGISRELVQGLAGDYAELGISSVETLARLVDLTAATEKLGNVDIGESQAFIQSIYQTVMRVNRDIGKETSYDEAMNQVTGQLAMFNLVENKTSLSLNNLAKGFPELTASATSFGLSMGEATSLMVPMVAAGFQVGASANSVKVSLQRLVDLTKENSQLIDGLRQNNKNFTIEAGVGIGTIQKLADSYNYLKATTGEQGTMEMFSNLFGVRQGPRMEVAIQNLAQFQDALNRQGSAEREIADKFAEYIQKNTAGLGGEYSKFQVKKFEDLSTAVKLSTSKDQKVAEAFTAGRQEFAEYIKKQAQAGADVVGDISTESGRALIIAAQGGAEGTEAQRKFLQEVEASLDTAETRYNRARETIKGIGRQIIPIVGELLKVIVPVLNFIENILKKIGPIGKIIIAISLGALALVGPMMKVMGAVFQIRSAFASMRGSSPFAKLKTQAIEVSESMVRSNEALFKMRGGLVQFGNKFFLKATLKEFKQLEKAMALDTGGIRSQRKAKKIFDSLGVSGRTSDFGGLAQGYQESIKAGFSKEGDLSALKGYRQEQYDQFGNIIVSIKTEAAAIGSGIAEAFLEALRLAGFDTKQKPKPPPPPKTPPSSKGGNGTPVPPGAPPGGASPAGIPPETKRVSGTKPEIIPIPPIRTKDFGVGQVYESLSETMDYIGKATKKQLIEFASSIGIAKVSGMSIKSGALKADTLRSALIEAISAPPKLIANVAEEVVKAVEVIKDVVQPGAPPVNKAAKEKTKKASEKVTKDVATAQAVKDEKAVVEQGVADEVAVKQEPVKKEPKPRVKKESKVKTEKVAEAQAEADIQAVEEQGATDIKLVKSSGTEFSSISKNARRFSSTVEQLRKNALVTVDKPIDSIIEALQLVGSGAKKTPFRLTKQKFFKLAEILGITLPPIFNQMNELLGKNGKALGVTRESLIELINAMTRTVEAPEILSEIAGETVLEFEAEVNRALASGKGGRLRFNFENLTGNLKRIFSAAFSTESGSIFTDATSKMPSKTGKQAGAVDYTKVTFRDLGYKFKAGAGRKLGGAGKTVAQGNQKIQNLIAEDRSGLMDMVNQYLETTDDVSVSILSATKKILSSLLSGVPNSRAKSALVRREMMTTAGYSKLISKKMTVPSTEEGVSRKEKMGITGPIDKMTETDYTKFSSARMKGIKAAKARAIEVYLLSQDDLLAGIERTEREFNEELKSRASIQDEAFFAGGKRNVSSLTNFDVGEKIATALAKRQKELEETFGKAIPAGAIKSGTKSALERVGKDLEIAVREEETKLRISLEKQEELITRISGAINIAKSNIAIAKVTTVKSEEGKALFGEKTKKAYIAEQQAIIDNTEESENIALEEKKLKIIKEQLANIRKIAKEKLEILNSARLEAGLAPISGGIYTDRSVGGGGSIGGASMMESMMPMAGQRQRGPRMPQIGPRQAFVDTSSITGGVNTVYEEIRQRLNIPAEIMDEVIKQLQSGYTNSLGEVKKAQTSLNTVGIKLTTEIQKDMSGLVEQLMALINASGMTVEGVRSAMVDRRNQITNLAKGSSITAVSSVAKKSAVTISKEDQNAAVERVMTSINEAKTATDEFLQFTDRPLRKLAEKIRDKVKQDPALQTEELQAKFAVDPGAKKEVRTQQIIRAMEAMGIAIEKGVIAEVVALEEVVNKVEAGSKRGSNKAVIDNAAEEIITLEDQIAYSINTHAINMPLKELEELLARLKNLPEGSRVKLAKISGKTFENLFESIELLITEEIARISDDVRQAVVPAIVNTVGPIAPISPTTSGAGGGARPPRSRAGGTPFYPTPTGAAIPPPINTSSLMKVYQYAGLLTFEFGILQVEIAKAVMRVIPFGTSVMNLIFILPKTVVGMYKFASSMAKVYKDSTNGLKGMEKFSTGISAMTKNALGRAASMAKSAGAKFIPGMSGNRGSGRGIGGMLASQVGMSAGMLGTVPLGMMGGNMLQGLVQSLSAIPVIGTPVVLILSTIAGVVGVLAKTSKTWGSANKETFENFKASWENIKNIFGMLIAPFEDFIGVIVGGTNTTKTGVEKAKDSFSSFSASFANAMTKIEVFVKQKIVPAIKLLLSIVIYLYNSVKPVVSALFKLFEAFYNKYTNAALKAYRQVSQYSKANSGEASAANFRMVEESTSGIESIGSAWSRLKDAFTTLGKDLFALWKNILLVLQLELMKFVNIAIVYIAKQIVKLMIEAGFAAGKGFVTAFVSTIPGGKLGGIVSKSLGIGKDLLLASNPLTSGMVTRKYANKITGKKDESNGLKENLLAGVDATFDSVSKGLNNGMNALINTAKGGTRKSFMKMLSSLIPEGAGSGLIKSVSKMLKQAFSNPDTAKAAGEALKNAIGQETLRVKLDFDSKALDAVSGKLGTAAGGIKDDLVTQLTAQKDASLKVFDDQIAAMDALAEAEDRLTATEEYQSNRRKMIRDNELRRENNRKDRSLAIYEGRIDDARSLDLQELKDTQDFNDELTELDSSRQRDLQALNRKDAAAIIKNQRDLAEKQFDLAIKNFEKYADKLLENGTLTKDQFEDQVAKMTTAASNTSSGIQTSFVDLFTALPGKIKSGMDPLTADAGFYSVGMDSLVETARTSFGLSTGVSDPNSILGLTAGMLGGIGSNIDNAFVAGGPILTSYGTGLDAVNAKVKELTGEGPDSTKGIFQQAVTDAADAMVAEALKQDPKVLDAAGKLVKTVNKELAKIYEDSLSDAIKKAGANGIAAMKKSMQDAKDAAAAASRTGSSDENSNTWWYRLKGTGLKGWVAVPASGVDRYIGNSKYDFTGTQDGVRPTFFKGGSMPYTNGGPTFGAMNTGIPATLHGGEFVLRKTAVDKYGLDMLSQMNKGIYAPKIPSLRKPMANYSKIANQTASSQVMQSESNHNYNFYVDNFIGETEWFNTMMKEYNVKVVPANQKQAGLESRIVKSYNGINRGM